MRRALMIIGVVLILLGIAPLVVAVIAEAIGNALDCPTTMGVEHVCPRHGRALGELLYTLVMTGILFILTMWLIPLGAILIGVATYLKRSAKRPPA